ncbi:glycosyl hydrolase family 28-related protein [Peribacillus frigoritolerans]|uniref:glycosyl hydrolase family 28-related protein n=1 Tax=Peribacillus frigoritolerans TaxID=450367 RepID=UPI002E1C7283|nr:glycosyl hydrolase family 28-related protein [Peribacillus frigoritolerans]
MNRRKFFRNFLLFIFAFIFGYTIKKDGENTILQRIDSTKETDGKSIADEIKVLKERTKKNTLKIEDIVVNVKSFGAKGDGVTDDTKAITLAMNYAKSYSNKKKLPIYFPPNGTYKTSAPLSLYSGLFFHSSHNNSEFGNKAIISNTNTDIFNFPNSDVTDISLIGIEFRGNAITKSTNVFQIQSHEKTGFILKYSLIANCGFNYFKQVIKGRVLGVKIQKNYINNGLGSFVLSGSDSILSENFIDNNSSVPKNDFLVRFRNLSLSKFENNYLTGSIQEGKGCIPFMMEGGQGNIISRNWFDYSEGSGMYLVNTEGHTIRDNFFRGNIRNPFDLHTAIITILDTRNIYFGGNLFIDQFSDANTFAFRKSKIGTDNITIRDNVYKSGYDLKLDAPEGESTNIFIDEPTTNYSKGKMWVGTKWDIPIRRQVLTDLSLKFETLEIVKAQSSNVYKVRVPHSIPALSLKEIVFSQTTPLEAGIVCEVMTDGTEYLKVKLTNILGSNITLGNKIFSLFVMY